VTSLQRVFRRGGHIADKLVQHSRLWRVATAVKHVSGSPQPSVTATDLLVVSLVRDGEQHVEDFLTHCFKVGACHVVLLDNGSRDRTAQIAQTFDRVTVLKTRLPYKYYKYAFKRYLFDRFCGDGWCLILDIDERFDYPFSDRLPFGGFITYLNEHKYTAVVCQTLDLFAEGPVQAWPRGGRALVAESLWYDHSLLRRTPYPPYGNTISNPAIMSHWGGIRLSAFDVDASLTKHPLLRKSGGARPSLSSSQQCANARIADVTCVLLHYKFDQHFPEKCRIVAQEESYWQNSREYKAYLRRLEQNPLLELKGPTAERFESLDQLVDNGFLVVSDKYGWFTGDTPLVRTRISSAGVFPPALE
jgi:glycosyltransferase involved in cell wall biosynthesis